MLEPVHLYVLAETYDVLKLKNNICRLLYDGRSTQGLGVAKDAVTYAYDDLPPKTSYAPKDHAGRDNIGG